MKVQSFELHNFASYKHIKFDMSANGLQLIHGPTGAGKSTLCDAIPWCLFGTTAKNGAVDDVRSWFTNEMTSGHIAVDVGDKSVWIARTRAPNDLSYYINGVWEHPKRGKDLADTQKQINALLGIDETLYLAGAYFHEFSQTAQFFTTTAKNRRLLCEQLGDLQLAKTLQTTISEQTKAHKKSLDNIISDCGTLETSLSYMKELRLKELDRAETWAETQASKLKTQEKHLLELSEVIQPPEKYQKTLNRLKAKLKALPPGKCDTCGAPKASSEREQLINSIHEADKRNSQNNQLIAQSNRAAFELKSLQNAVNTHQDTADTFAKDILKASGDLEKASRIKALTERELNDLEALSDIVATFRAVVIKNTINQVQDSANQLLNDHFDAEIRIALEVEAADKLDVTITKDGNACSYTQLSKGQRGLLKLCFSIAVMKHIAKHQNVQFNAIFLDEVFSGLDSNLKLKAMGLLEALALEYANVYFIEHDEEIKAMVNQKIEVSLVNGVSQIEKA